MYNVIQVESKFRIPADRKAAALAAVQAMDPAKEGNIRWGASGPGWLWVGRGEVNAAKSLEEALTLWRFDPVTSEEDGSITGIYFSGGALGQEDVLFRHLAPFVEEGSFLTLWGEDGAMWRWVFGGGAVKEVTPLIHWPAGFHKKMAKIRVYFLLNDHTWRTSVVEIPDEVVANMSEDQFNAWIASKDGEAFRDSCDPAVVGYGVYSWRRLEEDEAAPR